ncbi:MAG TPA: glycosyltransferase family 4 protein [Dehalococcoidia bacterium]|nr:glycosyltransferase family 4 protein [Dehalococcoidia bacterium]
MERLNIGFLFPRLNSASQLFLRQYLSLLQPVSREIFIVASDAVYRYGDWQPDFAPKVIQEQQPFLLRVVMTLLIEFRTSLNLLKILSKVDVLFLNFSMGNLLLPQLIAKVSRRKLVLITGGTTSECVRFGYDENGLGFGRGLFTMMARMIEWLNYTLADRIVVFTEREIDNKPGLKAKRGKVLVCGARYVDDSVFRVERSLVQREDVVGFIGRFALEKGLRNLVQAIPLVLSQRPGVKFRLLGDGPLLSEIERETRNNGLSSSVEIYRWVAHEQVTDYLNDFKLLVIPSFTEGLPNTMLEAMACGTPVLATTVGAVPDIIEDGKTGFMMKSNEPGNIAENIVRVLAHPDLSKVADEGRRLIEGEYTYGAALHRYKKIMESIR